MPYSRKIRRSHAKKPSKYSNKKSWKARGQTRNTMYKKVRPLPVATTNRTTYLNASRSFTQLSLFPQRTWATHRYSYVFDVMGGPAGECGPSRFFRLNAPNEPGVSTDGGHEAYGWNAFSAIYARATCTKAVVTVRGTERSDPQACVVMHVKRQQDGLDPNGQAAYLWQEKPSAWVLTFGGMNHNINAAGDPPPMPVTTEIEPQTFVATFDIATQFGIPYKQLINTLDYSCFTTNPPATQQQLYLGFCGAAMDNTASLAGTSIMITIDYQVMWCNPYGFAHS